MALKRSVLDRCDLYCPAPRISGQASYGGIPTEVYLVAAIAFILILGSTLAAMIFLKILIGSAPKWMLFIPLLSTALYVMFVLKATHKRRDIIVVLKESRRFEKREQRKRNQ